MKRLGGNLFDKIVSKKNLYLAHKNASKGKSHFSEIKKVNSNLDFYINELHELLVRGEYKLEQQDYNLVIKHECGKIREIWKTNYYPHRIIQWAILNVIQEKLLKSYYSCSYAAIPNKGIHGALTDVYKGLKYFIAEDSFHLKIDIKKFYQNINKDILQTLIKKKIKCNRTLNLLETIIYGYENPGLPIGSLLSQYFANLYLTELDKFCKEVLRIKGYYRYMDDVIILGSDKFKLKNVLKIIMTFIFNKLNLKLKNNYQIKPSRLGIDFVGYKIFRNRIDVRGRVHKKLKNAISCGRHKSLPSYYGWYKWTTSTSILTRIWKIILKHRRGLGLSFLNNNIVIQRK